MNVKKTKYMPENKESEIAKSIKTRKLVKFPVGGAWKFIEEFTTNASIMSVRFRLVSDAVLEHYLASRFWFDDSSVSNYYFALLTTRRHSI